MDISDTTLSLLSGLLGSLLTIGLSKCLDLLQKKKEHSYQLRKSYFDKKIASAESAISTWVATISHMNSLSAAYDRVSKNHHDADAEWFKAIDGIVAKGVIEIQNLPIASQNTVFLFFELKKDEHNDITYDPLIECYDRFSRIEWLRNEINNSGLTTQQLIDEGYYSELYTSYRDLSIIFKDASKKFTANINFLREKMLKYDY